MRTGLQIPSGAVVYSPDQRLSAARQGGADTAHYAYDASGRRVGKSTAAGGAGYGYDPQAG